MLYFHASFNISHSPHILYKLIKLITIRAVRPHRRERERVAERVEQRGKPVERRRPDDSGSGSINGVARKSAPDAEGNKPREVRFEERGGKYPRG
jgi:hypothetical protein